MRLVDFARSVALTVLVASAVVSPAACGREGLWPDVRTDGGMSKAGGRPSCTFKGFAEPVAYPLTSSALVLLATDFNRDGRTDLLALGDRRDGSSVELLTNGGKGAFVRSTLPVAFRPNPGALVAADFNGDGLGDLANQNNDADGIDFETNDGVLALDLGTGRGTLSSQSITFPTPQTTGLLAVGDFDADGRPDLAFAGFDYVLVNGGWPAGGGMALPAPEPTGFSLSIYRNAGQGTFKAPVSYPTASWLSAIVTGDFDGDGHLDVAELAASTTHRFGVFFNAGDGTFHDETTVGPKPDWTGFGVGVADFDGDGIDDLAGPALWRPNAVDEAVVIEVHTGARDRTFTVIDTEIGAFPDVSQVATGDFDGDGKPDIALVLQPAGRGGAAPGLPVAIFANRGDATFAPASIHLLTGASELLTNAITAGDFNGDGVADLAVATTGRFSPYPIDVHVLLSRCE